MGVFIVLLMCSILLNIVMLATLDYKNHCIDDLEISKSRLNTRKQCEILEILYHIQELTDFRKSYSRETVREYVNKKIELNTQSTNENV